MVYYIQHSEKGSLLIEHYNTINNKYLIRCKTGSQCNCLSSGGDEMVGNGGR